MRVVERLTRLCVCVCVFVFVCVCVCVYVCVCVSHVQGVLPSADGTAAGPPRVFTDAGTGGLSVSRAVGDAYLKSLDADCRVLPSSVVCVTPEVVDTPLVLPSSTATPEAVAGADRFLVLATDGLWDIASNDDVCDTVAMALTSSRGGVGNPAQVAADALTALSTRRHSGDNVTAIVVVLGAKAPPLPALAPAPGLGAVLAAGGYVASGTGSGSGSSASSAASLL